MIKVINILGINIHNVTMQEALETVRSFLNKDKLHIIYTPNAEIIMASTRINELKNIINSADLTVADGAGVVIGSKIQGSPLPERVAGFDLITNMFNDNDIKSRPIFLLGSKQETIEKTVQNLKALGVNVCGFRNGYFGKEDNPQIIELINNSKAEILLVALGAPKQEIWIYNHRNIISAKVCIGVGGSFDIIAGISKRAPVFFQKNNLEWLYRLYKEPWRFWRMLDLPRFIIKVSFNKIFRK